MLKNDKNSVIADKVFSYFKCLSSKFEVYVTRFRTVSKCRFINDISLYLNISTEAPLHND